MVARGLRVQLGSPARESSLGVQLGSPARESSSGVQLGSPARECNLGVQLGSPPSCPPRGEPVDFWRGGRWPAAVSPAVPPAVPPVARMWTAGPGGRWLAAVPQLSPSCPPAWRACGRLAQEVGGPRAVPPAVPPAVILQRFARQSYEKQCERQSRTLQLKLSRILHRGRRPLTCFALAPLRILAWHPQRNAFNRMDPKFT